MASSHNKRMLILGKNQFDTTVLSSRNSSIWTLTFSLSQASSRQVDRAIQRAATDLPGWLVPTGGLQSAIYPPAVCTASHTTHAEPTLQSNTHFPACRACQATSPHIPTPLSGLRWRALGQYATTNQHALPFDTARTSTTYRVGHVFCPAFCWPGQWQASRVFSLYNLPVEDIRPDQIWPAESTTQSTTERPA